LYQSKAIDIVVLLLKEPRMKNIQEVVINNLAAKAGDLNEPGKIVKFISMYDILMDRLYQQADMLSKNANCGGCSKHKKQINEEPGQANEDPRQGKFEVA